MILPLSKNGVEPYYSKTCESCFKQASNNVSVSSICFHECGKFNSSHGQLAQMQGVSMVYCSGRKRQNPSIRVKARTGALRNRSISGLRRKWPVFGHLCRRPLCGGFCDCESVSERSVTGRYHKGTMLIEAVLQIPGPYVEVSGPVSAFPSEA